MDTVHSSLPTAHSTVAIAGSTERSVVCAEALAADARFRLTGIITPNPKPIGRAQQLTPNPLHTFALRTQLPVVLVEDKLDDTFQARLHATLTPPDILLVVDFGYLIRPWMLAWPTIAPLNVHPSDLPKYRGSSPGQFAIAFGEHESAVSLMVMDAAMDHGPIIDKLPFTIEETWTAGAYYAHAFALVRERLTQVIIDYLQDPTKAHPQPDESPTPIARMLRREDGYIPYSTLLSLLSNPLPKLNLPPEPIPFLDSYTLPATSYQLYCLWRAFHPWPGLWTRVTINGQEKRMKLLEFRLEGDKLFLDTIQIEGKTAQPFVRP